MLDGMLHTLPDGCSEPQLSGTLNQPNSWVNLLLAGGPLSGTIRRTIVDHQDVGVGQ